MSIYQNLYCACTKRRFYGETNFQNLQKAKTFLFVLPHSAKAMVDFLPGLAGLIKGRRGLKIHLLITENQGIFLKALHSAVIEKVTYQPPIRLFNKAFKSLRSRLGTATFDVLADLTRMPNRALAYLAPARYRIGFFEGAPFPFYNLAFKSDENRKVFSFWPSSEHSVRALFVLPQDQKKELMALLGREKRNKPLLFINRMDKSLKIDEISKTWAGPIVLRADSPDLGDVECLTLSSQDERLVPYLLMSECYLGSEDEFGRLAWILQKKIL